MKMKLFYKRIFPLFLITILLGSCSKETISVPSNVELKIAVDDKNFSSVKRFTNEFELSNPNIHFTFDVRKNESLNYYLRHDRLDADIICLEDFKEIELSSSHFVELSTSEYLNRFSKYIQNYITCDEKAYCLPSPGGFYCYCINLDLANEYNLEVPTTFSEMMDYASNINDSITPFVSSFEGESVYLDAFMQSMIPAYFSNPKGYNTFLDVYHGNYSFNDSSSYENFFNAINSDFRNIFTSKFLDPEKEKDQTAAKFFDGEALLMTVTPQMDFEKEFEKARSRFNYSFLPYLGSYNGDAWLPSTSNFFLAVSKDSYSGEKRDALNRYMDFFSKMEGQQLLMEDEYGEIQKNRICYLVDSSFELKGTYAPLNEQLHKGRVYFVDNFLYVFNQTDDSLEQFAKEEINANQLIDDFDYFISLLNNYLINKFYIPELEGKGDISYQVKETMAEFLKLLHRRLKMDAVFLEDSFLKENIFEGTFYENELDIIFDSSLNASICQVDGKDLVKILEKMEDFYSYYGISKRGNLYVTYDLNPISENKTYRILLSDKYLNSHKDINILKKESINPFEELKSMWFENR